MNELKKADEIVRALRDYASDCDDCGDCLRCDFACVCGEFDYNAPKIIADLIDSLTAQLNASQRREKAAVEYIASQCRNINTCANYRTEACKGPCCGCQNWKWCGPQAEKGEAE